MEVFEENTTRCLTGSYNERKVIILITI